MFTGLLAFGDPSVKARLAAAVTRTGVDRAATLASVDNIVACATVL